MQFRIACNLILLLWRYIMADLNTLTSLSSAYAVKTLAEFKGVELESGQYLVRKIEKGTGLESKGCVVPKISPESVIVALENDVILENVIEWYQEQVAEVAKAQIAAGARVLTDADMTLEKVVEYLSAKAVSEGRISKERLASWFDYNMASVLTRALNEKFANLPQDKIAEQVAHYKGVVVQLAKKDLSLPEVVIANCKKAFALLDMGGNNIVQYCLSKLDGAAPKTADMMAL